MNTAIAITAIIGAVALINSGITSWRDVAKTKHSDSGDAQRLDHWKHELQDALGMDRTRDWDDIRNAAKGIRSAARADSQAIQIVLDLPAQPPVMDAQHAQPQGYLHGYEVAIGDAKRAARKGGRR